MFKEHKSQLEGALTEQIWDNLNTAKNNDCGQFQCMK